MEKKLKILFVPCGSMVSPASRYRVYRILPFLEKNGVDCTVYSIFSDNMTDLMIRSATFKGLRKILYYARVIMERLIRACRIILLAGKFDLVFLQRTTFPLGMEKLLKAKNRNIIFDIDDPIYLPDREEKGLIGRIKRWTKKREVISILHISKCVIAENNYIKSFVRRYCKDVHIIVGPIDITRNYPKENRPVSEGIVIGWIGTPSTTPYFKMLDGVLRKLGDKHKISIRLIGASPYSIDGLKVELVNWSEATEVMELHKFDIGVMPMPDDEWTRGKVGCKMLQYMANAIPSVVSHTPTTSEIIEDGVNGFLAGTEEEWIKKLSLLIEDPGLMKKIGNIGRRTVEERFAIEVSVPRYVKIFRDCIK